MLNRNTLFPRKESPGISTAYRWFGVALLAIGCFFEITALFAGVVTFFSVFPLVLFFLMLVYMLLPTATISKLKEIKAVEAIVKIISNAVLFIVIAVLCIGMFMFIYSSSTYLEQPNTVIVMGCQVNGDTPSVMLNNRISAAYDYLIENENAVCIATGGTGSGENISEAEAIKRGLVSRGIDSDRIYLDDQSVNTAENIANAAKIIEDNHLDTNVVIATDGYHQMRSQKTAATHGLTATALNSTTPWYIAEPMILREICAVAKCTLLGY